MRFSRTTEEQAKLEYNRGVLRGAFGSLFMLALKKERKARKLPLAELARSLGVHRSVVSKWFGGEPNWGIDTMADLALALDIELIVKARSRKTGEIYTPYGVEPDSRATDFEADLSTDDRSQAKGSEFVERLKNSSKPKVEFMAAA